MFQEGIDKLFRPVASMSLRKELMYIITHRIQIRIKAEFATVRLKTIVERVNDA